MAWTNWGFDGTINEAQWAQMAGLLGNDYVAAGNGDCLVTAVPGARSVSVAAGTLYGDGVVSVNSGAETVAMTTPVNGQWYVIALRRTWATNTAALVAIAGATTSTTTPTAPPTSFPTLNTDKGVLTDQPIAWAWCNSANTTVVVYDIRMRAVKSLPPVVANQGERDAKFMTPTQGLQVWRNDLGAVETYYGLYNASTNPGGRDTAGWDSVAKTDDLVLIRPTSVVAVGSGSTATVSSVGVVTATDITSISLNGVFSSKYSNYKIVFNFMNTSATLPDIYFRLRAGGVDATAASYNRSGYIATTAGVSNSSAVNETVYVCGLAGYQGGLLSIDISNPFKPVRTYMSGRNVTYANTIYGFTTDASHMISTSYDGFSLILTAGAAGNSGGTAQVYVYGYNEK